MIFPREEFQYSKTITGGLICALDFKLNYSFDILNKNEK